MKRHIVLFALLVSAFTLCAKTIYLNTGGKSLWGQDSPEFFVHAWGAVDTDVHMTVLANDPTIFQAEIPDGSTNCLFTRNQTGTTAIWTNEWNRTGDLTIGTNNCYTITGFGTTTDGKWSVYTPSTENPKYYITGNAALVGTAKEWLADAIEIGEASAEKPATYTFTNLTPNIQCEMKITNGTWDYHKGYSALDADCSSDGISGNADGNIVFTPSTNTATVTFDGSKICVTFTAGQVCKDDYGVMVGENYIAAAINPANETEYMITDLNLKKGDTFTMYNNCVAQAWVIEPLKEGSTSNITIADGKYQVGESGLYDIYFTLNPDAIYIGYRVPTNVVETTAPVANAPMYNLLGVPVDGNYRGVVIQNGKKFIVK